MGPARRRRATRDEDAASQVISFLMAGMILSGGIGAMMWETEVQQVDDHRGAGTNLDLQAASVLDIILDTEGVGWEEGPDGLSRLGLKTNLGTGIDMTNLQLMQAGLVEGEAINGLVDSQEMVEGFGLDPDEYGMHLRITPKILVSPEFIQKQFASVPTALVADWDHIATVTVGLTANDTQAAAAARSTLDTGMGDGAAYDRELLADLGLDYRDRVHLTTDVPEILVQVTPFVTLPRAPIGSISLLGGDVYPDDKEYLVSALKPRLSDYDLIVIGSGVDHKELQEGVFKSALQDWIEDGGNLIVLGSEDSASAWLNPLFTAPSFQTGLAGPMTASSTAIANLERPYGLEWSSYPFPGEAWNIASNQDPGRSDFDHPLQANGHSVLAISHEDVFDDGMMAFTSLPISAVWDVGGKTEAKRFLTNVIVYTVFPYVASVTLDFGEPVPDDLPVGLSYRTTRSDYPGYGTVILTAELLLWKKML